MVKFTFSIFLFLALYIFVFPQKKEIEEKAKSLEQLRDEIIKLERELDLNKNKEKNSYTNYTNLNKQKFYFEKIISSLRTEEQTKSQKINKIKSEISSLENQIGKIKSNYSKYIVYNYMYGRVSELEAILDSKNFRQAIFRLKHLRNFSDRQQNNIKLMSEKITELNLMHTTLAKELEEKRLLTAEKNRELDQLQNLISSEQKALNELRKDRAVISKQISDKRKSEAAIKNLIDKLIAESEKQKIVVTKKTEIIEEKKEFIGNEFFKDEFPISSVSFSSLKGKLPLPISRGRVISEFGTKQNPKLNTVSVTYGIDILCTDPVVKSVSDGIVSAIEWMPGYGTVVIISHSGDYRTVYGHLENIQIAENQRVSAGSIIGYVSNSLEGRVLHFQIWNGRKSVDPIAWLKR